MANLALFDLDHTLIPTDSDHEWGRFMVKLGIVEAESFARENDRFFADYKAGKLDIHAYLVAMLTPLAKYPRSQLKVWHDQYMHEVIKPAIVPAAMELVNRHRDAGDPWFRRPRQRRPDVDAHALPSAGFMPPIAAMKPKLSEGGSIGAP